MAERFLLGRSDFDVVENEDGLHHCGRPGGGRSAAWSEFPGLEGGDGAYPPRKRIRAWALFTAFCRRDSFGR